MAPQSNQLHTRLVTSVFVVVLAVAISLRPFGYDKDYAEYVRFYEDPFAGATRMALSALSAIWAVMSYLGLDYVSALTLTTAIALACKATIARHSHHPIMWTVLYCAIFVPMHEMTQVRLALALGFATLALLRAARLGRCDAVGATLLLAAASVHTSLLVLAPTLLSWRWQTHHATASVALAAIPLIVPTELVTPTLSLLDSAVFDSSHYLDGTEGPANLLSARSIILTAVCVIGALSIDHVDMRYRPLLSLTTLLLSLYYLTSPYPVIAGRLFEIAMLIPLIWMPAMPPMPKRACVALYLLLAVVVTASWYLSASFFTTDA